MYYLLTLYEYFITLYLVTPTDVVLKTIDCGAAVHEVYYLQGAYTWSFTPSGLSTKVAWELNTDGLHGWTLVSTK